MRVTEVSLSYLFRLPSFLAPEKMCKKKLHVHTTQLVSCSRKWLHALEKSDLQSIVQSAAEFHDRNSPEIEHVLLLPVSGASFFCTRYKWRQKPRSHRQVFWRKKLAHMHTTRCRWLETTRVALRLRLCGLRCNWFATVFWSNVNDFCIYIFMYIFIFVAPLSYTFCIHQWG